MARSGDDVTPDDPHRETNGPATFAFCVCLWLAIGLVYVGWRVLKWLTDA